MRVVVVTLLLAGTFYIRFAPSGHIPTHYDTPEDLKVLWSKPVKSKCFSMRFSPDSKQLIVAGGVWRGEFGRYKVGGLFQSTKLKDGRLQLWSVESQREIRRMKVSPIFGGWNSEHMLIMPDCSTLITGSHYGGLKVIDILRKQRVHTIWTTTGTVCSLQLSPDQKTLAIGTIGGVEFFDGNHLLPLKVNEHYGGTFGANVCYSQDSKIAKCTWFGSRRSHYVVVKTAKRIPPPHSSEEFGREYSPCGRYFVILPGADRVELWQRRGKRDYRIRSFNSSLLGNYTMGFSPDGKTLAIGGLSSTETPVRFYNMTDLIGRKLARRRGTTPK